MERSCLHEPRGSSTCSEGVVFVSHGRMWIEGGKAGVNCGLTLAYTNDIWSSSDGTTWTKASKAPEWAPRQWPCVATDSSGTTWLAGGYIADFTDQTATDGTARYQTN